ncbi:glycosyltransferase family 2 protein [Streptomyces spirodelae]|uniref:Glycosyltransferase n=1 Tax=Streptomyces spirodelae TaxID=2812904 RepID=A0ABS3WPD1_9ACTN|nr:glycosyltransferase [Streptomyces spirodelae]MBO8184981.1 glycosyltransferase [Streptomyces spirodelae]
MDPAPTSSSAPRSASDAEPGLYDRLGVVIATRDRRDTLGRTLDKLLALPERPRILVADNASTDGTPDMVTRCFPAVQLLRLPVNRGALARNEGVRALHTPYIAFSDDDSWWEPGALRKAADLLAAHPRTGLLAAGITVGPEGRPDPLNAALATSPLGEGAPPRSRRVLGFLACAAVARRQAYLDVGGYHPLLFFGAEETLLAYDLTAAGWEVVHHPDVVARHAPAHAPTQSPGNSPAHTPAYSPASGPGGTPADAPRPGRQALIRRNELLIAWLRRPLPVALSRTAALCVAALRDEQARSAARGLLPRLPAALRLRRPLPRAVEEAARRVEATGMEEAVPQAEGTAEGTAA